MNEETIQTIERVARQLAPNFLFGPHTTEDLVQHAFLVILEGDLLRNWDPDRGSLWTYVKQILWNRFCNLKRDSWERRDKPCHTCVMAQYCRTEDSCSLFDDKMECDLWSAWYRRNERKKDLQRNSLGEPLEENYGESSQFDKIDNEEFFGWCSLIVDDKTGLQKVLDGESIGQARLDRLVDELRECVDGEGLE